MHGPAGPSQLQTSFASPRNRETSCSAATGARAGQRHRATPPSQVAPPGHAAVHLIRGQHRLHSLQFLPPGRPPLSISVTRVARQSPPHRSVLRRAAPLAILLTGAPKGKIFTSNSSDSLDLIHGRLTNANSPSSQVASWDPSRLGSDSRDFDRASNSARLACVFSG